MKHLGLVLALCAMALAPAQAATLQSGDYGDLLIAVNHASHQLTGYYNSGRGEQPHFSCIFYIKGALKGSETEISTYFPETAKDVIKGKLKITDATHMRISLADEHGGCANVMHFADASQPADFQLLSAHPKWKTIRVIKSKKAYFFASADAKSHGKTYVVEGDGICVTNSNGTRMQVEYWRPEEKTISGWIDEKEFYP
jgi:hypothetical protein